jgi:acyl-coenzyme A synthetase/AMP-(fatty) acid ligase
LGRIDFQIKYRGYRLELEGVEALLGNALNGHFGAIGYDESSPGNFSNLAILYDNALITEHQIRSVLPEHLLGATVIFTDSIPRNNSEKIDRRALARLVA